MQEIGGKMIYDTIEELVDPKHTALLVIDIQNDHGPGGFLAKKGRDISWVLKILPNVKTVIADARRRGMLIIFTSNTLSRDQRAESPAQLRFMSKGAHLKDGIVGYELEDSWGNEVLEELGRKPNEPWIVKYRSSAFHGTRLDFILKSSQIETAVVVGLVTEGCVESTVRDLVGYGYYPVLLRDCVTSSREDLHDAALLVMSARYDVISLEQYNQALPGHHIANK
jgi:nicotinamidase-related amidase